MILRTIEQIENTERDVKFTGGNSQRLLLASDGFGFSFSKTIIPKGGPHLWHYKHHYEMCYCVSGYGVLTMIDSEDSYNIEPGTMYGLDWFEPHTFEALSDVVLVCVFNPPLTGKEHHDKNGVYEIKNNHSAGFYSHR